MKKSLVVLLTVIIFGIGLSIYSTPISGPSEPEIIVEPASCFGIGDCITGKVTEIIDGSVIFVNRSSIKFVLIDTEQISTPGGKEAKKFVEQACPVGSKVLVDEDGGQKLGSFGRMLAVVYCDNVNINSALLEAGLAKFKTNHCKISEFSEQDWTKNHGC